MSYSPLGVGGLNKLLNQIIIMKTANEIRQIYLDFWKENGHVEIQNAPLLPKNDPTLLFVNSGMFPLVPYLLGEEHPKGNKLHNFQKCLRVQDIEDVGDNRHTTFFEMMGNWSLGDYFKAEQIPWFLELYHEKFGLDINKLYVSVFEGDDDAPEDSVAIEAWKTAFAKYGIDAKVGDSAADIYKNFDEEGNVIDPKNAYKIFKFNKKENWWDRGSKIEGEPGGPDSEMFFDLGKSASLYEDEETGISTDNGRFIEIGNSVFMEYKLNGDEKWEKLAQQNVDFGGGFERVVMCVQGKKDVFDTELFEKIIKKLEEMSGVEYKNQPEDKNTQYFRVIADHIKGAVFILGEEVYPGNKDQGYVLRRLIRRMIRQARYLGIHENLTRVLAEATIETYEGAHQHLEDKKDFIFEHIEKEEKKFRNTIEKGLKEFDKIIQREELVDGKKAFWIYETYGFPVEIIVEELEAKEIDFNKEELLKDFNESKEAHQAKSRAGAEKKFKGGLADQSVQTTRLHTAHHLLLAALQQVLGHHVHQRGSNITGERLRIDFSHTAKLTPDEVEEVEAIVNEKMQKGFKVVKKTLPIDVAQKLGAEMEFGAKYGDMVNVYLIVDPEVEVDHRNPEVDLIPKDKIFSMEFCGGPHVENTAELCESGIFKIKKQESVGAGARRIKAVLG